MSIISSKTSPIIKVNDKKIRLDINNNEQFVIKKILDNDNIIIKNDRIELEIPSDSFQRCFYVAYAITSHKAQAQTYDHEYTIQEWDKLSTRCKYVCLSRATKYEYVNIIL